MDRYKVVIKQFEEDTKGEAPFEGAVREFGTVYDVFENLAAAKRYAYALTNKVKEGKFYGKDTFIQIVHVFETTFEKEVWRSTDLSADWNEEELKLASEAMVRMGHMSYDEFCKELYSGGFNLELNSEEGRKAIGAEMSRKLTDELGCEINVNIKIGE